MAEDPLKKKNPSTTLSTSGQLGPSARAPGTAQQVNNQNAGVKLNPQTRNNAAPAAPNTAGAQVRTQPISVAQSRQNWVDDYLRQNPEANWIKDRIDMQNGLYLSLDQFMADSKMHSLAANYSGKWDWEKQYEHYRQLYTPYRTMHLANNLTRRWFGKAGIYADHSAYSSIEAQNRAIWAHINANPHKVYGTVQRNWLALNYEKAVNAGRAGYTWKWWGHSGPGYYLSDEARSWLDAYEASASYQDDPITYLMYKNMEPAYTQNLEYAQGLRDAKNLKRNLDWLMLIPQKDVQKWVTGTTAVEEAKEFGKQRNKNVKAQNALGLITENQVNELIDDIYKRPELPMQVGDARSARSSVAMDEYIANLQEWEKKREALRAKLQQFKTGDGTYRLPAEYMERVEINERQHTANQLLPNAIVDSGVPTLVNAYIQTKLIGAKGLHLLAKSLGLGVSEFGFGSTAAETLTDWTDILKSGGDPENLAPEEKTKGFLHDAWGLRAIPNYGNWKDNEWVQGILVMAPGADAMVNTYGVDQTYLSRGLQGLMAALSPGFDPLTKAVGKKISKIPVVGKKLDNIWQWASKKTPAPVKTVGKPVVTMGVAGKGMEQVQQIPGLMEHEIANSVKDTPNDPVQIRKDLQKDFKKMFPNSSGMSENDIFESMAPTMDEVTLQALTDMGVISEGDGTTLENVAKLDLSGVDPNKLHKARIKAVEALISMERAPGKEIMLGDAFSQEEKAGFINTAVKRAALRGESNDNSYFEFLKNTGKAMFSKGSFGANMLTTAMKKDKNVQMLVGYYTADSIKRAGTDSASSIDAEMANAGILNMDGTGREAFRQAFNTLTPDEVMSAIKNAGSDKMKGISREARTVIEKIGITRAFADRKFGLSFMPKFFKWVQEGGSLASTSAESMDHMKLLLSTNFGDEASANAWFEEADPEDIMGFITTFASKEGQEQLSAMLPEGVNKTVLANIKKAVTRQSFRAFMADPIKNGPLIVDAALRQLGLKNGLGPAKDNPLLFYGGLATVLTLGGTAISGFSGGDSEKTESGYEEFKRRYNRYEPQSFEDAMDY